MLVELWQMAAPVMARVLKLVEEAQRAKDSVRKGIVEATVEAEAKMLTIQREVLLNLDMFEEVVRDVIREAEGVADNDSGGALRDTAQAAAADGPRPVTRGSGFRKGRGVKQNRGG